MQTSDPFEDLFESTLYVIDSKNGSFKAHLKQEQDNDPVIGPAKRLILNGDVVSSGQLKCVSNQLRVEENILTKSGHPVLPAPLRCLVFSKYHEYAHFGTEKTHSIISARYYWPNVFAYSKCHISTCSVCTTFAILHTRHTHVSPFN